MRFLLLPLFVSLSLFAQAQERKVVNYVWAESGLTLRAEGKPGAKKLAVIPYGAAIEVTGGMGEFAQVTDLKSVTYVDADGREMKSDPYVMEGYYQEVIYQGKVGFVFSGYLCRYSPEAGEEKDLYSWLEECFGEPFDAKHQEELQNLYGDQSLKIYPNGVMIKHEQYEGGGSTTVVFPAGTVNEGYLIAAKFWGVTDSVNNKDQAEEEMYFLPEMLHILEDGTLEFEGDMSVTTIQRVGGLLIIRSEGGC